MKTIKTDKDFDAIYNCDWDEKYEGCDDEFIRIHKQNPKRVWSVIETDGDEQFLCAGFHRVNAIYHLITKEDWSDENEEYRMMY